MKKDINIFEFPFNLGLIKKEHDIEPGVKNPRTWLLVYGFTGFDGLYYIIACGIIF
ncbi:hypothetical protein [Chryseobacterium sp. RU37D]|uniref:hypothetical protein n=1 Tax=Chryseobacterium sp. RU37D TaxID=1907397 RepID=UPI002936EDF7|nr:hypothetical protein [Chryseobacterium sp. RU37D]